MSRKKMLENYSEVMFDQRKNFSKCAWDLSIDKVSLKDRPHVIDYIESITGLKTLCGRLAKEPYRLVWVDHGVINGNGFESRCDVNRYFKIVLNPRGYKLTEIDFNIGGL